MKPRDFYIGEGFAGLGVNAAHIDILLGPRSGPAGMAFANSLATPSQGHCPFMVILRPGVPVKPMTLYVNKAEIRGELHANATWGAPQAGIARAGKARCIGVSRFAHGNRLCSSFRRYRR